MINKDQQEKRFFSNFKNNVEDKNSDINPTSNINFMVYANTNKNFYITNQIKSTLLSKVINTSNIDLDNLIKLLCNPYIKNKYIKVVKYKKIILTIQKL